MVHSEARDQLVINCRLDFLIHTGFNYSESLGSIRECNHPVEQLGLISMVRQYPSFLVLPRKDHRAVRLSMPTNLKRNPLLNFSSICYSSLWPLLKTACGMSEWPHLCKSYEMVQPLQSVVLFAFVFDLFRTSAETREEESPTSCYASNL